MFTFLNSSRVGGENNEQYKLSLLKLNGMINERMQLQFIATSHGKHPPEVKINGLNEPVYKNRPTSFWKILSKVTLNFLNYFKISYIYYCY